MHWEKKSTFSCWTDVFANTSVSSTRNKKQSVTSDSCRRMGTGVGQVWSRASSPPRGCNTPVSTPTAYPPVRANSAAGKSSTNTHSRRRLSLTPDYEMKSQEKADSTRLPSAAEPPACRTDALQTSPPLLTAVWPAGRRHHRAPPASANPHPQPAQVCPLLTNRRSSAPPSSRPDKQQPFSPALPKPGGRAPGSAGAVRGRAPAPSQGSR